MNALGDSPEIYVVPISYRGQSCYRVLYGVYKNSTQAQSSIARLPQEFLNQASPPQVVPISKVVR
jgi:hypothetical protein